MRVKQFEIFDLHNFEAVFDMAPDLALIFGDRHALQVAEIGEQIKKNYPNCIFGGCSTAGNIAGDHISEAQIVLTIVSFDFTELKAISVDADGTSAKEAGIQMAKKLNRQDLKHVLLFTDGLLVDSAGFIEGMKKAINSEVCITGGMAADNALLEKTLVFDQNGQLNEGYITAIGFYGNGFKVDFASESGWRNYGIQRRITKSKGNELLEIDGIPALQLCKEFLGSKAAMLPASGFLMPISFLTDEGEPLIRTIIDINQKNKSLIFAGDVPEGIDIQFMKADAGQLIDGASHAAKKIKQRNHKRNALTILVSCAGRRLVMKQMADEELEVVSEVLRTNYTTGFYSYGEFSPHDLSMPTYLQNQTMTITTLLEE